MKSPYTSYPDVQNQQEYVLIIVTVPEKDADTMREIMAKSGAGIFGNYRFCSFSTKGIGRFIPNKQAHPYIGNAEVLEQVVEEKIETICSQDRVESVVHAIKEAHPYEQTIIEIYPLPRLGYKY